MSSDDTRQNEPRARGAEDRRFERLAGAALDDLLTVEEHQELSTAIAPRQRDHIAEVLVIDGLLRAQRSADPRSAKARAERWRRACIGSESGIPSPRSTGDQQGTWFWHVSAAAVLAIAVYGTYMLLSNGVEDQPGTKPGNSPTVASDPKDESKKKETDPKPNEEPRPGGGSKATSKFDQLIAKLEDEDYAVREKATLSLIGRLPDLQEMLRKRERTCKIPETRARLRRILASPFDRMLKHSEEKLKQSLLAFEQETEKREAEMKRLDAQIKAMVALEEKSLEATRAPLNKMMARVAEWMAEQRLIKAELKEHARDAAKTAELSQKLKDLEERIRIENQAQAKLRDETEEKAAAIRRELEATSARCVRLNKEGSAAENSWRARKSDLSTRIVQLSQVITDAIYLKMPAGKEWDPKTLPFRDRCKLKVSFNFVDQPLDKALKQLGHWCGLRIDLLEAPKPREIIVNLKVRDMDVDLALEWICRLAEVSYQIDAKNERILVGRERPAQGF